MTAKESAVEQRDGSDAEIDLCEPEHAGSHEEKASDEVQPAEADVQDKPSDKEVTRLRISISLRSLLVAGVIVALMAGIGVLTWLYLGERHKLNAQIRKHEGSVHAEKVALDYAVNAAAMDFKDLNAWKVKLVAGTSPELKDKLTNAADSMQQLLVPLEWTSTAQPLAAKVRSDDGGTYVVDCFVSVLTKTVQSPEALQSTATYSVTMNSNDNWQITDVGGIGAVTGQK